MVIDHVLACHCCPRSSGFFSTPIPSQSFALTFYYHNRPQIHTPYAKISSRLRKLGANSSFGIANRSVI
ncbi:hypothetical protein L6452_07112 [Arctium lappa]|uniref:Uncharacterized protein n=1 Tax=Arctium lappa TaxID=4217 RepID=A0ACB9ELL7_ARCLA|nr:hypothetical protein L6452_07112 [Arctium lappa]